MRRNLAFVCVSVVAGLVTAAALVWAGDKKKEEDKAKKVDLDQIPKKVMETIKEKFPDADITSAEKETEEGKVVYDIELKSKGRKYEMDIHEDGTLIEIEKQVDLEDMPKAVMQALEAKYPKAKIEEIMEVNKVKDKLEKPDHYEIMIVTTEKKKLEVTVSLDGKEVKGGAAETDKKRF